MFTLIKEFDKSQAIYSNSLLISKKQLWDVNIKPMNQPVLKYE